MVNRFRSGASCLSLVKDPRSALIETYAAAAAVNSARTSAARSLADFGFCRLGGGEGSRASTLFLRLRGAIVEVRVKFPGCVRSRRTCRPAEGLAGLRLIGECNLGGGTWSGKAVCRDYSAHAVRLPRQRMLCSREWRAMMLISCRLRGQTSFTEFWCARSRMYSRRIKLTCDNIITWYTPTC